MISNSVVQNLCAEAVQRFGKLHRTPAVAVITEEEMHNLGEQYATAVLLEAFRRTGSVVKKEPTISHNRILDAIGNLANRVLGQGQNRTAHTAPAKPLSERIKEVQEDFYQVVGSLCAESFVPYNHEVKEWMDAYGKSLHNAFEQTAMWLTNEQEERQPDQQEIIDHCNWVLAQAQGFNEAKGLVTTR